MTGDTAAHSVDFENTQLPVDALPSVDDVTFGPLERAYFWAALGMWALVCALVITGGAILQFIDIDNEKAAKILPNLGLIAGGAVTVIAFFNVWEISKRGFAMRTHDILYRKGLVWRSVTAVPFSRVQHVETHRGPVDRLAGLSELKIYTAGGLSSDLTIPGLTIPVAASLRQAILTHTYSDGVETGDDVAGGAAGDAAAKSATTPASGEGEQ